MGVWLDWNFVRDGKLIYALNVQTWFGCCLQSLYCGLFMAGLFPFEPTDELCITSADQTMFNNSIVTFTFYKFANVVFVFANTSARHKIRTLQNSTIYELLRIKTKNSDPCHHELKFVDCFSAKPENSKISFSLSAAHMSNRPTSIRLRIFSQSLS